MSLKGQAAGLAALCLVGGFCTAAQAAQTDFETFNQAGQAAIGQRDYVLAERHFRQARQAAEAAGRRDFIQEMDARRAALYINDGEPSRALPILEPYIGHGATRFMLADYLMALRLCNRPQEAEKVFSEEVRDWQKFPIYGLQSMGDMYLRQGKYAKAEKVYEHILSREKAEDVPYVQLGYAFALARQGRERRAAEAYGRMANMAPRYDSIIAGDGAAFLAEGRVKLARKLYALLGKDAAEREGWQLKYAKALVHAGQDYNNNALNFRRDEYLSGRSFYHEAAGLLRELMGSADEDIAHEARALMAENKLHNELLYDSDRAVEELLAEDSNDLSALAVQGERELLPLHRLELSYDSSLDNKRNHERRGGLTYDTYLGHDFYLALGQGRRWLQDEEVHAAFWESSLALRRKFDWGEIAGEWIRYEGAEASSGYSLSLGYDLGDAAKFTLAGGYRLHSHAGTARAGIREKYFEGILSQQLTRKTSLQASFARAKLTDGNRYTEYGLNLSHLLQVKHNFSDRLEAGFARSSYDREVWQYDSPERRVEYTLGYARKWDLPKRQVSWQCQAYLSWGKDDEEPMGFAPGLRLSYRKGMGHGQSLEVGAAYSRYFRQVDDYRRKRPDGYALDVSYSWEW